MYPAKATSTTNSRILSAINGGATRPDEIQTRAGVSRVVASFHLQQLARKQQIRVKMDIRDGRRRLYLPRL